MRDYLDNRQIKLSGHTPRRPLLLALLFCGLALLLLYGDQRGLLAPVRGPLEQVLSPAARQLTAVRDGVAGFWMGVGDVRQLRAENEALRQEVTRLHEELITHEEALAENANLRQQLAIEEETPWHLLGAEVTVRLPDAGRRVILIARGTQDGVRPGMAVVGQTETEPTALVGIVEEVSLHTASILLITDFGSQISARVLHDTSSTLGLVQGQWQRGSRLRLADVTRDLPLAVGDTVVSAGLTSELNLPLALAAVPDGIPIGEVEAINTDGHTQVAELRPYVDPDQVKYVWVILNQSE